MEILCPVIVCATEKYTSVTKINKNCFLFPNSFFSYFLRSNGKTKMEEFKTFLHEAHEVPRK